MEDLEELLDKLEEVKVQMNRKDVLYYLTEENGHMSEVKEKDIGIYNEINELVRDILIDTYAGALKLYYKYDRPINLTIDDEKGFVLRVLR